MKKKLLLKGEQVLKLSGTANAHKLSLKARISYPTADRYVNRTEKQVSYSAEVLAAIFTDGMDMTPEEVLAMPMSTFFDIVEVEGE